MTEPTGQAAIEPVSIVLPGVDPDRLMLAGVDVSVKPRYTISEVAKSFLYLTKYWIRWCDDRGLFDVEEADPVTGEVVRREIYDRRPDTFDGKGNRRAGARSFTLAHIELMVHALATAGRIDGEQAARALAVVHDVARVHGYLPDVVGAERAARIERQALLAELRSTVDGYKQVSGDGVRLVLDRLEGLEAR